MHWDRLTTARTLLLVLAGMGLLVASAWLVALPLGLCAAGAACLALAYLTDPNGPQGPGGRAA